mmetsp:Transcript_45187/g.101460  ORF Transcript_45187/g.101460 Transcript_45187/m.101460 type:complete len:210 (-) Transcript_45187:33-662(-)
MQQSNCSGKVLQWWTSCRMSASSTLVGSTDLSRLPLLSADDPAAASMYQCRLSCSEKQLLQTCCNPQGSSHHVLATHVARSTQDSDDTASCVIRQRPAHKIRSSCHPSCKAQAEHQTARLVRNMSPGQELNVCPCPLNQTTLARQHDQRHQPRCPSSSRVSRCIRRFPAFSGLRSPTLHSWNLPLQSHLWRHPAATDCTHVACGARGRA